MEEAETGPDSIFEMTDAELEATRRNMVYFAGIALLLILAALFLPVPGVILAIMSMIASWFLLSKNAIKDAVRRKEQEDGWSVYANRSSDEGRTGDQDDQSDSASKERGFD